jgi:transmembrane sensor
MSSPSRKNRDEDRAQVLADASAWLARLHGPNRTAEVEEGFHAWLRESERHAAAFEHMTDMWDKAVRLRRRPMEKVTRWEVPGFRVRLSRAALAMAAVAFLAVSATVYHLSGGAVTTGVGEQRVLTLEDGSHVYLNTTSRAVVRYSETQRRIELDRGEALFQVAPQPNRPFVVVAGDRRITALGTSFIVRRGPDDLAVTLVEGRIAVSSGSEPEPRGEASGGGHPVGIALQPGQRLTYRSERAPRLDRPALDKLTAWRRGQVALDGQLLVEAAAEMNRYSHIPLRVKTARSGSIRVSGIFRAGDSENFARAVSKAYGLEMVSEPELITLTDASVTDSIPP